MLGRKVTVAKDDWENITALAKREVASTKQVRKLKKERDEAVQKYDELKDKTPTEIQTIINKMKAKADTAKKEAAARPNKRLEDKRFFIFLSLDGLIFCFCNTPSGFLQIVLQKRLAIAFCVLLLQNACQDVSV